VNSGLEGSWGVCAAAQQLDKGGRHEVHVSEEGGGRARETSDCGGRWVGETRGGNVGESPEESRATISKCIRDCWCAGA